MFPNLFPILYIIIGILVILFDTRRVPYAQYKRLFLLVYTVLALLFAFRYLVGPDTSSYMALYEVLPNLSNLGLETFVLVRSQPLFTLLMVTCKTITNDFVIVQMVQALLFFNSFYLLLGKLEIRRFYILFLFFGYMYLAEMSALRECLGLSFCFYAILYYLKEKWIKYYILVTIGFFFHSSMLIFYLVPFIRLIKELNIKNVVVIILLSLLIPIIYVKFIGLGIEIGDNSINRYGESEATGIKLSSLVNTVVLLCLFVYYTIVKRTEGRSDLIYLGGILYVMIGFIGSSYLPIFYRLTAHFSIFFFYAIAQMFNHSKKSRIVTLFAFLWLSYTPLARFISGMNADDSSTYCSVFSSDEAKKEMKRKSFNGLNKDSFN